MKSEAGRPISSIQTSTRLSQSWPPNSSLKKLDACLFFFKVYIKRWEKKMYERNLLWRLTQMASCAQKHQPLELRWL